jgi:hypothetical protein
LKSHRAHGGRLPRWRCRCSRRARGKARKPKLMVMPSRSTTAEPADGLERPTTTARRYALNSQTHCAIARPWFGGQNGPVETRARSRPHRLRTAVSRTPRTGKTGRKRELSGSPELAAQKCETGWWARQDAPHGLQNSRFSAAFSQRHSKKVYHKSVPVRPNRFTDACTRN